MVMDYCMTTGFKRIKSSDIARIGWPPNSLQRTVYITRIVIRAEEPVTVLTTNHPRLSTHQCTQCIGKLLWTRSLVRAAGLLNAVKLPRLRLRLVTQKLELVTRHNRSWRGAEHAVAPPSLLMGYDTPPVIHTPTNVDARLSPQPIKQHGTYRIWVMTHIQPTNRSTRHPSMTVYDYIVDEPQLSYQVSLW